MFVFSSGPAPFHSCWVAVFFLTFLQPLVVNNPLLLQYLLQPKFSALLVNISINLRDTANRLVCQSSLQKLRESLLSNSCSASLSVCKLWCLLVSFVMHCSQKNTHTPRCFHTLWHELVLYDCLCRRQILALCDISGANICCVVLQPYSKSHNWHLKIPQMNL